LNARRRAGGCADAASLRVAARHVMPRNGIRASGKYVELLRFHRISAAMPIPASFML
jgi:hypothetical protein